MRTPTNCLVMCGVILWTAACSSPDVTLGSGDDSIAKTNGGGGSGGSSSEPSADAGSACDTAVELPSADEVWWEPHWTNDAPPLPISRCGYSIEGPDDVLGHTRPSVVAKWVAPHDGQYFMRGWMRDMGAIFVGSRRCGDPQAVYLEAGCATMSADVTNLPAPPFDLSTHPGGGFNLYAEPGDTWFVWFYPDSKNPSTLEPADGVLSISTVPLP